MHEVAGLRKVIGPQACNSSSNNNSNSIFIMVQDQFGVCLTHGD